MAFEIQIGKSRMLLYNCQGKTKFFSTIYLLGKVNNKSCKVTRSVFGIQLSFLIKRDYVPAMQKVRLAVKTTT